MVDYYKVLEVEKSADDAAIKKAYKRLALKWHPDRNVNNKAQAEQRFKEVSEAYEVLSDPNKRAVYDRYGEEGLKAGAAGGPGAGGFHPGAGGQQQFFFQSGGNARFRPTNPEDIFRQFFGGGFDFSHFDDGSGDYGGEDDDDEILHRFHHGGMRSSRRSKPEPLKKSLPLSLEDLFTGTTKKLKVTRKCVSPGRPSEKVLTVNVKAGWKAGTLIRFAGEGDEVAPGVAQDIEFVVEERPHPLFKREDDNLHCAIDISLEEALVGFTRSIKQLDGKELQISNNKVTQPNQEITFANHGMPSSKQPGRRGSLIVHINVKFPPTLTDTQKDRIRAALK